MGQAPSSRHLRTVTTRGLPAPVVLPSARLERAIQAPRAVLSQPTRGPLDLATIDDGWGEVDEPAAREVPQKKAQSTRIRATRPIPVPRPLERNRATYVPTLELAVAKPVPPAESSAVAIDAIDILEIADRSPQRRAPRAPSPGIVVAPVLRSTAAITHETTSVAGVPTLRELLAARAEARLAEERSRVRGVPTASVARTRLRDAPELFPETPASALPRTIVRRDVEGERAIFALGTFVGALAVGLSVLAAMLLK